MKVLLLLNELDFIDSAFHLSCPINKQMENAMKKNGIRN